jgi:branched-chain amino acid transport system ATP-binding protein
MNACRSRLKQSSVRLTDQHLRERDARKRAKQLRMTILSVSGITKSFGGVRAVAGISFAVQAGEMLALIGPNGAGKSTCFNMLNGQIPPDTGRITLNGENITGLSPRRIARLGVGRTFQITATFASMTVRENVQTALLAHHQQIWSFIRPAAAWFAPEADALLAQTGMADQATRAAGVLAYGDLKRLELAIALANDPRLLLMDEPTAGMAPAERVALMRLTRDLASQKGIAVLFTEHDMDVVFGVADRILVLNRGELIAEGDGPAIRTDPRVREVYLGSGATSGGH